MSARGKLKLTPLAHNLLKKIKKQQYQASNSRDFKLVQLSLKAYHLFYKNAYTLSAKLKPNE